jgi:hypothetical protein
MKQKLLFFFFLLPSLIFSQSFDTEFGKNRVQYNDDFKYWNRYETNNFITYWYGKSKMVARIVMPLAEMDHTEIQTLIEHKINDKIEILVYSDLADQKQSNIGSEQSFSSVTGQTKIVGNKLFVYFDGNHQNLRRQIREGIANVYINSIMFGSGLQEIVQNAVLLDLPAWYKNGLVSFAGSQWDELIEDELRELLDRDKKYYNFESLAAEHPRVAGHAMWYYISQNYGKSSISNILYLSKISRSLENSISYTLNITREQLELEWSSFYTQKYKREEGKFSKRSGKLAETKNKSFAPISTFKYNASGNLIAYAYNELGKVRVEVLDLKTKQSKTFFKKGFKNSIQETDYNYPLISWHPQTDELSIIYENRDRIYLRKIDINKNDYIEQVLPEEFQRVYSVETKDDINYLFSANIDGYSDLFDYDAKYRTFFRITNDFYDDLDATLGTYEGANGIFFASNRKSPHIFPESFDTILPISDFDLYFYNLDKNDGSLTQLTDTDIDNERYPIATSTKVYYLSNKSGVINQYEIDKTTKLKSAISNENRNIIRHAINQDASHVSVMLYDYNSYQLYFKKGDDILAITPYITEYRKALNNFVDPVFVPLLEEEEKEKKIPEGWFFQSKWEDPENIEVIDEEDIEQANFNIPINNIESQYPDFEFPQYISSQTIAAGLKFRLDNFTTKADNEVLFEGLESFSGDRAELGQRPLGILLKATIKDLFEDHVIEGGVRIPTSFDGSEYFVTYEQKKSLIDKKYILYRKGQQLDAQNSNSFINSSKKQSLLGMYQLKYPFDIYTSIRATAMLRFDKFYSHSTDAPSFESGITHEKRAGIKLEYIFDNTLDYSYNILHGTRYKFYIEAMNQFNLELIDGFNFDFNQGFTGNIGLDARHYIPLLKKSVIALRTTGAISFGNKPMLYHLGGVNNWLLPKYDDAIAVADRDFSFKTYVPHLRGFDYNIRNGTSYVLANAEIRVPLFQYFLKPNRGASFFRNFQFIFFADAGTAWYGSSPFSDQNPINTAVVEAPPTLLLEIQYYRDPLVIGYGGGIRTTILGYYLKLDYARGIETRNIQDGKFYLSMGLDF